MQQQVAHDCQSLRVFSHVSLSLMALTSALCVCAGLLLLLLRVLVPGDIETCQRIPVDTDVNADVDVDAMSM